MTDEIDTTITLGYGRVSTLDQNTDAQHDRLQEIGCAAENIYIDKASGKHANRPKLQEVLRNVRAGDEFVVTKLDRLGRSIPDLYAIAVQLADKGVRFRIADTNMSVDFADPFGKMFYGMLSLIAEFERDLTIMRTHEGLAAGRARGRVGGRPATLNAKAAQQVRGMYEATGDDGKREHTVEEIAHMFRVTRSTIYRSLRKTVLKPDLRSDSMGTD